jgi:DUF1707 SHOCT-like domain
VRIGDEERERFFAILREHYAAGRLSLDELRGRVEIVAAASYADEADDALAELPVTGGPVTGEPVTGEPVTGETVAGREAGGRRAAPRRGGLLARRGHAEAARPGPGWERTAERFRDPASGTIMRVWVDPADGSRHYVPDDATG